MREHGRRNLVESQVVLAQKHFAGNIPRGGKPLDSDLLAISINFVVFRLAKFQPLFLRSLSGSPGTLTGRIEQFFGINHVDRSLLEFDCVASGRFCDVDKLPGNLQVSVMINSNFGYHEHPTRDWYWRLLNQVGPERFFDIYLCTHDGLADRRAPAETALRCRGQFW